jgi:hypothetical protein
LKKREEAMNDPNNPLYALRSNYYRNNYNALTGLEDEIFKLQRFPLFKLIKDSNLDDSTSVHDISIHDSEIYIN